MYVLKRLLKAYDFTTGMEMEQLEHVLSKWFGNSVIHSTDLDLFSKGQIGSYGHITSKKSSGFHSVNQFSHKAPPLRVPSWPPFLPPSPPYPPHHPWRDIKGGSGVSGSGSSWVFHSCPQSIPFTLDQSHHSIHGTTQSRLL